MTHLLTGPNVKGSGVIAEEPYRLQADFTMLIPALCQGTIVHRVTLETIANPPTSNLYETLLSYTCIVQVGEPELMVTHNLIVVPRAVLDGDVVTHVFNLSSQALRIKKGEVVSRLIRLVGCTWSI